MINIRCRNCGRECVPISSETITIAENTYQTTRKYKCPKCKQTYTIIGNPIKLERE